MIQVVHSNFYLDDDGCPEGGNSYGPGFAISWQRGPLGKGEDRAPANGAFVESVLVAARERLRFYQSSKFKCMENQVAITLIDGAMKALAERTADRESRCVEGTHEE